MDMIKNSQIYYVNSTYKITRTDSSFLYQIQLPPNSEFNRVACLAASIPKSFYTIETGFISIKRRDNSRHYFECRKL